MPIDQQHLEQWIRGGGGWLYHRVAFEQLLPWILRDGLLPREQTALRGVHLNMPSRPTHVYLTTSNERRNFELAGMGSGLAQVAVHASSLNPTFIDSDEDKIGAYATSVPEPVLQLPGAASLRRRDPAQRAHEWAAANSSVIDQPAWVWYSLCHGAVAYRSPIPVDALHFAPAVRARWKRAPAGAPVELLPFRGHPYYCGPPDG